MKITTQTSATNLDDLLKAENPNYLNNINAVRIKWWQWWNFGVNIQNLSWHNVYVETIWLDANTTDCRKIADWEDFNFVCVKLKYISLISDAVDSVCRVTIV